MSAVDIALEELKVALADIESRQRSVQSTLKLADASATQTILTNYLTQYLDRRHEYIQKTIDASKILIEHGYPEVMPLELAETECSDIQTDLEAIHQALDSGAISCGPQEAVGGTVEITP